MTYDEAYKKMAELNARGWAFSMSQGMGRVVSGEVSGGFMHYWGASAGEFYANTFPELIEVASDSVEQIEERWRSQNVA